MRCAVCKVPGDEVELFEGVSKSGMIMICSNCANTDGVPLIKKPSEKQLDKADKNYSVRERMEKLSGRREITEISADQSVVHRNLAKLRMPEKKQFNEEVLDDYYWTLNMARRRKKMSLKQFSQMAGIGEDVLESIEKGQIPENFKEVFFQLESSLGIKLLKYHVKRIDFSRNSSQDNEEEILRSVKERMSGSTIEKETDSEKKEKLERLSRGEMDFSKRADLQNVTLNDLVEIKRRKEKKEAEMKKRAKKESMVGEDLDLDIEGV
ncbi:MAG: hypothetical protein NUV97_00470 [archaeon]|nr:hypothetical protein [archaeon]MCR4324023.1 hypothetical protein [Nanoarchaeota archaeon]